MRLACWAWLGFFVMVSCEKKQETTVEETRRVTSLDKAPKLFATSDERFRDAKPSPVAAATPDAWLVLPPSQMRLLNYRFGKSGAGEVWVSISSGGVLENVNRWLLQFGAEALDIAGMARLRKVQIAGKEGVFVEAKGVYSGGMGREPNPGFSLAGIVAEIDGRILTVKMVGPEEDVKQEREKLLKFAEKELHFAP